jgi:hypothetical protein
VSGRDTAHISLKEEHNMAKKAEKEIKRNKKAEVEETNERGTFDPEAMNAAAKQAAFRKLDSDVQQELTEFWAEWFKTAGHKRLGRMMIKINKEIASEDD